MAKQEGVDFIILTDRVVPLLILRQNCVRGVDNVEADVDVSIEVVVELVFEPVSPRSDLVVVSVDKTRGELASCAPSHSDQVIRGQIAWQLEWIIIPGEVAASAVSDDWHIVDCVNGISSDIKLVTLRAPAVRRIALYCVVGAKGCSRHAGWLHPSWLIIHHVIGGVIVG